MHALIHHVDPVLTQRSLITSQHHDVGTVAASILHVLSQELETLDPSNHRTQIEHLAGFGSLLSSAAEAAFSPNQKHGHSRQQRFLRTLETFSPAEPDKDAPPEMVPWLRIAIAYAMAMTYNLLINVHELRHKCNAHHVQWLLAAIRSIDRSSLKPLPMLKTWL